MKTKASTVHTLVSMVLAATSAAMAVGCSCDDDKKKVTDAGTDGSRTDGGGDAAVTNMCPEGECNLVTNGCDSGACYFADTDAGVLPLCAAEGTKDEGQTCSEAVNDCKAGLFCATPGGGGGEGTCRRYCCDLNQQDSCNEGEFCGVRFIGTSIGYCVESANCDPVQQDCGASEEGCYVVNIAENFRLCVPPSTENPKAEGETCSGTDINECEKGTACLEITITNSDAGTQNQCLKYCRPAAGDGGVSDAGTGSNCPSSKVCQLLQGSSTLGVCVPDVN